MNQKPNDGGPAFPRPSSELNNPNAAWIAQDGMSLRAHFAGQALPAVISGYLEKAKLGLGVSGGEEFKVASDCVIFADALIAELSKETP